MHLFIAVFAVICCLIGLELGHSPSLWLWAGFVESVFPEVVGWSCGVTLPWVVGWNSVVPIPWGAGLEVWHPLSLDSGLGFGRPPPPVLLYSSHLRPLLALHHST